MSEQRRMERDWRKNAWDDKMKEEHGDMWCAVFTGWIQQVSNDMVSGQQNALSEFMYRESHRVLAGAAALVLPSA